MGSSESKTADMGLSKSKTADMGLSKSKTADMGLSKSKTADMGSSKSKTEDMGSSKSKTEDLGSPKSKTADMGLSKSQTEDMGSSASQTEDMESSASQTEDMGSSASQTEDNKYVMVAAVDFGTTYCRYAFAFNKNPDNIYISKNWIGEHGSHQVPTCVLTDPNGEFHKFGYEAEHLYSKKDRTETEPDTGYNLYRNFKMLLHKQGIRLSSTVTSTSGNVRPAIDIFTMALKYLKDHMLSSIELAGSLPPDMSKIRWVVTVPAIWSDQSKKFMRHIAFKAGLIENLYSDQLWICLEPEAASIFCRSPFADLNNFGAGVRRKLPFMEGEKILILDAGGGTVDITAHQIKADENVEEIIPASGGPWGGVNVDEELISLLGEILGADTIKWLKVHHANMWLKLMLNFEKAKKDPTPAPTKAYNTISIVLPHAIFDEYKNYKDKSIKEAIKEKSDLGVSFNSDELVISQDVTNKIFTSITKNTVGHVKALLQKPELEGLNYIMLVGGFGECKFLQKAVLDAFSGKVRVLIPMLAQLAVIKGAVMYGHRPQHVSGHRARATYGVGLSNPFDESKHDPARAVWTDKGKLCRGCFVVMVKKGELLQASVPYTQTSYRQYKDQTAAVFPIHCTDEENPPMYVDDPEVRHLGTVTLTSPKGPKGEKSELQLTFGATEILVEAQDKCRDDINPVSLTIDFLHE